MILPNAETGGNACGLMACLNSLVLDYVAQQKIGGTHIRKFLISQFPVLPPCVFGADEVSFVLPRVMELTYTSNSMRAWAEHLRYDGRPFAWNEGRRALLRAELDAYIGQLYGMTRDQMRYILDPKAVMGADYPSETFRVLQDNEKRKYGEYRTARLVMDAWDQLERGELS